MNKKNQNQERPRHTARRGARSSGAIELFLYHINSKCGSLFLLFEAENMLFCGFSDPRAGRARLPKELKQRIASNGPLKEADERNPHAPEAAAAVKELTEYCAGRSRQLTMPIRLYGSKFQKEVWDALLKMPYGVTTSYGRIAAEIGRPGSARAVGTAVGMNPLSIIVPCHRVLPASGALGNYGGGVEKKDLLLRLEGAAI